MTLVQPVVERLRERGGVNSRGVPGMTMVLARQVLPAGARVATDAVSVTSDWPSSSLPQRRSADHAAITPATPPIDVNHLTERVVAAIDRRMMAARERMGM